MLSIPRALTALLASAVLGAPALGEPAMWTLKDSDTTIHLFGTIHLLPEDTDWKSARIEAALDASDSICFEVDVEGRATEALGLSFNHGIIKDGTRLTDKITDEQEEDLRETAEFLGVPFHSINVMQPWFATLTLGEYAYEKMGLAEGVEFSLYPEIREKEKTLCEIETLDEQLGSFWRMPLDTQIDVLFTVPEDSDDLDQTELFKLGQEEFQELLDDWLAGDVAAIGATIDEEASDNQVFHDALLTSRNARWVPRIEEMLEREGGHIFIAVGAAHLAGKDSVIKMLRDKGYEIEGP